METPSFESTREFFNAWQKTCEGSIGRAAEIPAVGPSREKYEKVMKGFSLFINFYATWMDSVSDFNALSMQAMKRMQERTIEPESRTGADKELYDIWMETYSEIFNEFLRSDHFASDMGRFMSVFTDVQTYNRELVEENLLVPSNLPTKTDIDEINKELYHLRKKVKELSLKLGELSEQK